MVSPRKENSPFQNANGTKYMYEAPVASPRTSGGIKLYLFALAIDELSIVDPFKMVLLGVCILAQDAILKDKLE